MLKLLAKIWRTPSTVIPESALVFRPELLHEVNPVDPATHRALSRSLAIREIDGGSTAAEEEELKALTNAYYDAERFGIHFVASPRHADILIVTGPVTKNMEDAVRRTYDATPDPKIVVAFGDGAIDGGMWKDSYAVVGGVGKVIPVNYEIPGDPPTAMNTLIALREIMRRCGYARREK